MRKRSWILTLRSCWVWYASLSAVWACTALSAESVGDNAVVHWNSIMLDAVRADNTSPTLSSRNLAILNCAIFDGVNSVSNHYQCYRFSLPPSGEVLLEAIVHAAGQEVTSSLYPSLRGRIRDLYLERLSRLTPSVALTNGLRLGHTMGQLMVELRSSDGSHTDVPYIPSDEPGQWRRTPPLFRPPLTPNWRYVAPFCLPEIEKFLPPAPPRLGSEDYAVGFNQVKELGERNSVARTAEQGQIATFWSDFSYTAMPPGHWHEIAGSIILSRNLDLEQSARLLALLSLSQADVAIVCWEAKFRHNVWRPITAIQRADEDDNEATEAASEWQALLAAPPFPAYTSGHSSFSRAAAEVLTDFFGTDAVAFTAKSDTLPGVVRHFESFLACADEIGLSRIYGGIHFMFDNVAGKVCGQKVGEFVGSNCFLPMSLLPLIRLESRGGRDFSIRVHGHVGRSFIVESSTNMSQWSPLTNGTAIAGGVSFKQEMIVLGDTRYLRVIEE
jgi:membrane-associated phospholipid phosphatase